MLIFISFLTITFKDGIRKVTKKSEVSGNSDNGKP